MRRIYLAGPIGQLDGREERIRDAIGWAEKLRKLGFAVMVPHCFVQWYQPMDLSYAECMALDEVWLRQCEVVFRMPGKSPGADAEVALARSLELPVFTDLATLQKWAREQDSSSLQVGGFAMYRVAPGFWRRVKLVSEHTLSAIYSGTGKDERAFSAEWERGTIELLASECRPA